MKKQQFIFDVILEKSEICNLKNDRKFISTAISNGQRVILSGRRNTGKTSLVKSIIVESYKKQYPKSAVIFVDFMGVKNLQQISDRLKIAYEKILTEIKPSEVFIKKMGNLLKTLRPSFSYDPITSSYSFSLAIDDSKKKNMIEAILIQIAEYHKENRALIIFDEFQDISFADEAEALLRNYLQNLPGDLPVIILGSKKHLLSNIFSKENAPFSNWGRYYEISKITADDYMPYINERFSFNGKNISLEATEYLLCQLQSIPECVNIVCDRINRWDFKKQHAVSQDDIDRAIIEVINERSGLYEEKLSRLTEKEELFLVALAYLGPVKKIYSKDFLSIIKMSTGGCGPLACRLEDLAIIYKAENGYIVGDPLLERYLKYFRTIS